MQLTPSPALPLQVPELPAPPPVMPILPDRGRPGRRQAPLPDLVAVRPFAIPDCAPPFDGADGSAPDAAGQPEPRDGPAGAAGPEPGRDAPDADGPSADSGGPGADSRRPGPRSGGPGPGGPGSPAAGPGGWPSQFAQVLAETLAGSRPAQQLAPWTTEQTRQRIRQLGPLLATGERPRVRRVMTSAPARDVLEMTAVVGFGPRVRVLALRLERAPQPRDRWRCTAIESA
jgi:Family of unknown function (DUF6459)